MLHAFSFKARRHAGRRSREPNAKRNAEPDCGMTAVAVVGFEGSACVGATSLRRPRRGSAPGGRRRSRLTGTCRTGFYRWRSPRSRCCV